jgi:hypothetical protein
LLIAYGAYARRTVRHSGESEDVDDLTPLTFDPSKEDPPRNIAIVAQLVVGLLMIVGGAERFVEEVVTVAEALGISALVLSLVLAPLATELREKLNSVLWVRRDKDTLAVGNITGAMAFQSTVPIALGLVATGWDLDRFAVAAGVAGLAGGALALWQLPKDRLGMPVVAAWSALFAGFVAFAALAPERARAESRVCNGAKKGGEAADRASRPDCHLQRRPPQVAYRAVDQAGALAVTLLLLARSGSTSNLAPRAVRRPRVPAHDRPREAPAGPGLS